VTLYDFGEGEGVVADEAVVEAFATPRKCLKVDGRGRAIGLRNEKDIETDWSERVSLIVISPSNQIFGDVDREPLKKATALI
jgi:hypothetical protein